MNIYSKSAAMIAFSAMAMAACAETVRLSEGTNVNLKFVKSMNSKNVKEGQTVTFTVAEDVEVGRRTVLRRGQKVTGYISKVDKKGRYGVNASMRIALNPIKTRGTTVILEAREKGKHVAGDKSTEAAAATVGGAALLGPIGLIGGYFIVGKEVKIKAGDILRTEVAKTAYLRF